MSARTGRYGVRWTRRAGVLLFLAALLVGCGPSTEERLASAVQARRVDLRQILPEAWDRVCVFGPYTRPEHIAQHLGFEWKRANKTGIAEREDHTLLVFALEDEVVEHIMFERSQGDFAPPLGYNFCLWRAHATFDVQAADGQPGRLRVVPVRRQAAR